MKIIDSVLFKDEIFMLFLRLSIMADKVDKIIIVESNRTFSGTLKPYNLEKYWPLLFPWHDKIIYHKLVAPWPVENSWVIENWQRNQLESCWASLDLDDNDIVILNDLDEIIRPEVLENLRSSSYNWHGLHQPCFYFKFNYMATDSGYMVWSRAIRYGLSKQLIPNSWRYYTHQDDNQHINIHHAGWHWSYLMNHSMVIDKIKESSHQEFNNKDILDNVNLDKIIKSNGDLFNRQYKWDTVLLDNYFPDIVKNYPELYIKGDSFNSVKTIIKS